MRALKTIVLIILFIVLLIVSWISMAGLAIETTFLNYNYYEDLEHETDISAYILESIPLEPADYFEEGHTKESILHDAFTDAFDEDWMETQFLQIIDNGLDFVKGEQEELTLPIDMSEGMKQFQNNIINSLKNLPEEEFVNLGIDSEEIEEYVEIMIE